jgi:hypothetical protein
MIVAVRPDEADTVAGRVAGSGTGGPEGRPGRAGRASTVARPGLFERLGGRARVTVVSASPGSGKTMLLR